MSLAQVEIFVVAFLSLLLPIFLGSKVLCLLFKSLGVMVLGFYFYELLECSRMQICLKFSHFLDEGIYSLHMGVLS